MFKNKQFNILLLVFLIVVFSVGIAYLVISSRVQNVPKAQQGETPGQAIRGGAPFKVASIFSSSGEKGDVTAAASEDKLSEPNVRLPGIQSYQADAFTGSTTVGYPIEVLPGRGGLTPNLSLNYSSSAVESMRLGDQDHWDNTGGNTSGAGDIGLGWSLSGIGGYNRDPQTGVSSLSLNGSHYKMLEVKREIVPSGTATEVGECGLPECIKATYRTENDAFLKIVRLRPRYGDNNRLDGSNADIAAGRYRDKDTAPDGKNYVSYDTFAKLILQISQQTGVDINALDRYPLYVWDKSGTKYSFGIGNNFVEGDPARPGTQSDSYFVKQQSNPSGGNLFYQVWYHLPLKEIKDRFGNTINFEYESTFRELGSQCFPSQATAYRWYPRTTRIKNISYNDGQAKIKFNTDVRTVNGENDYTDVIGLNFPCHQAIYSEYRIGEIQVLFNDQVIRSYEIVPTNPHLYRKKPSTGELLGRFLGVDSIILKDKNKDPFEVRSKFEYYTWEQTKGAQDLLLWRSSNVVKDSVTKQDKILAYVLYEYNVKAALNAPLPPEQFRDHFLVFDENEKLVNLADQYNYFRSVRKRIVTSVNSHSGTPEFIHFEYIYPAANFDPSAAGISPFSMFVQAQGLSDPGEPPVYASFEFKGHPKAVISQYKKCSSVTCNLQLETRTESDYYIGEQYKEFEDNKWNYYHTFYPFIGTPRRSIAKDSDNNVRSVSQTSFKAFLPYTLSGQTAIPATCATENDCNKYFAENPPRRDYTAYDKEIDISEWWSQRGKADAKNYYRWFRTNESKFIYNFENKACSIEQDRNQGVGSLSYNYYDRADQNATEFDNKPRSGGVQWGNPTHATSYRVNKCQIDTDNNVQITDKSPYSQTHTVYYPVENVGNNIVYLINRPGASETFACGVNSNSNDSKDCNQPKRLSKSYTVYDNQDWPWSAYASADAAKGKVTGAISLTEYHQYPGEQAFDKFPDTYSINHAEWANKSLPAVLTSAAYDQYGQTTKSGVFDNYGTYRFDASGKPSGSSISSYERETITTYSHEGAWGPYVKTVKKIPSTYGYDNTVTTFYDFETGVGNLGLPVKVVDPNGAKTVTVFDTFGRTQRSCSPTEVVGDSDCPENSATVKYKYYYGDQTKNTPFAVETARRDDPDTGTPTYMHSWSLYNGLGQLIQSQAEKEADGAKVTVVDSTYNGLGSVEKQSLPREVTNPGGTISYQVPDWSALQANPGIKKYEYDSLGRKKKEINPDSTKVVYDYMLTFGGFGAINSNGGKDQFVASVAQVTNDKGQIKKSISDPLGRLVQVEENLPGTPYITTYRYDPRGLLTDIYDAQNQTASPAYKTHIEYNHLGQKVRIDDPDLGTWYYKYNALGSLTNTYDSRGVEKRLEYDRLNRLMVRNYFGNNLTPILKVTDNSQIANYEQISLLYDRGYEGEVCQNGLGRLCNTKDQFTLTEFSYDIKGRVTREVRSYKLEQLDLDSEVKITEYEYDAMDRIKLVRYPTEGEGYETGEEVRYTYNDSGQLVKVEGQDKYLAEAKYNNLGLPTEETFGGNPDPAKNVKNIYKYYGEEASDPAKNYRLKLIEVAKATFDRNSITQANYCANGGPQELLKICYEEYDPIGNIKKQTYPYMTDTAQTGSGSNTRRSISYSYDNLNRLLGSEVTSNDVLDPAYGSGYDYDSVGKITRKCEGDQELTFTYAGSPVHAPKQVQSQAPAGGRCRINAPGVSSSEKSANQNKLPQPTSKPTNLLDQVFGIFQ